MYLLLNHVLLSLVTPTLKMSAVAFASFLFNKEVIAAVVGGGLALLLPNSSGGKRRSSKRLAVPPCWHAALFVCILGGLCVHGTKEMVNNEFSLKLHRQEIPLHSKGGIVHHKSAYYGTVQIGGPNPVQSFDVVFDTGSGHLVLPSTFCRSETCRMHRRYRRKNSPMADDIDVDGTIVPIDAARDQITVSFGTGEVTGVFVTDQVCLGTEAPLPEGINLFQVMQQQSLLQKNLLKSGQNSSGEAVVRTPVIVSEDENATANDHPDIEHPLTQAQKLRLVSKKYRRNGCIDMNLVATTDMTDDPFASFIFDGILGLGLTGLSQNANFNFLDVLPSGLDVQPMFSVFLAVTDSEESEITFGSYRPEHFLDPEDGLKWATVQNAEEGYWQIDILGVTANGIKIDFCNDGCRAVVDTGTSLLGVPSKIGKELRKMLRHLGDPEDGACGAPGPQLEFDLGNITLVLDPLDIARPEFLTRTTNSNASDAHSSVGNGSIAGSNGNNLLQEESWHQYVHDYDLDDEETAPMMLLETSIDMTSTAAANETSDVDLNITQMQQLLAGMNTTATDSTALNGGVITNATSKPFRCLPMLMNLDLPEPLSKKTFILGEPVLQKYYTAFDRGNLRIGFGMAKHVQPRPFRRPKVIDGSD